MHIPDGFLNIETVVVTNTISISTLGYSAHKIKKVISPERIPLMGILTAFIFTIQLISFPVAGGTSVHLIGTILVFYLTGPFSTIIIISSALLFQALLFQHGGILTFGANIFNMGIIPVLWGILLRRWKLTGAVLSAFLGSITGAFFCGLELYISKTISNFSGIYMMILAHIPEGIIESFFTFIVIKLIYKIKPEICKIEKV